MKEMISDAAIEETAAAVVAEYGPEFVYSTEVTSQCWYSPATAKIKEPGLFYSRPHLPKFQTGCLVGVILDRLNVTGHHDSGDGIGDLVDSGKLDKDISDWATHFLSVIQDQQDSGTRWGKALEIANLVPKSDYKTSDQYVGV